MYSAPNVPEELKKYKQFVLWKLEQKPNQNKPTKVPYNPRTGGRASVSTSDTWSDFDTAILALETGKYSGIGFVFTKDDPFAFIDIDDCYDLSNSIWKPHALHMLTTLPQAAWETSQSGHGLHGIVRVDDKGGLSGKANKWVDESKNCWECYNNGRFIAFGHCNWTRLDLPLVNVDILAAILPDAVKNTSKAIEWVDAAEDDYSGPKDDDELIRRAMKSKGGK